MILCKKGYNRTMDIYLDSDGASIRKIAVNICKKYGKKIILVKNISQNIQTKYGEVVTVDQSPEAADLYIVNRMKKGDLVLTNDLGLSSLVLGKGGKVLNFQGQIIDETNIDSLMFFRHMNRQLRRQKIYTTVKKREEKDDYNFLQSLEMILKGESKC